MVDSKAFILLFFSIVDPSIKPRNIYAEVDSESKIVHFAFDIDGTVDNFTLLRCLPDKYDHSFCKVWKSNSLL